MPTWSVDSLLRPPALLLLLLEPSGAGGSSVPGPGQRLGQSRREAPQPGCPEGAALAGAWVTRAGGLSFAAPF